METVEILALTLGASWAAGINLYAAMLMIGWMGSTGQMELPPGLEILAHPGVMLAAGAMYCVEFFADKIPGIDTGWDTLHTFIRIPAGAMMAAGASQGLDIGPESELIALILGGTLTATSHAAKSGTRVLINTSPEPFTNWTASVTEDVAVFGGLWAALNYPWWFLAALAIFIALVIWLLPKIWRALKRISRAIGSWFKKPDQAYQSPEQPNTEKHSRREDVLKSLYHDASTSKSSD